ncbi:MAG: TSUP family transporter [Pseudomonadota bacterium]
MVAAATDLIAAALAQTGLIWLALIYLIAGVVRGFSGFGTALIVVPVAGIFLGPLDILVMITVTGLVSNFVMVPGAWRVADRAEVGVLALAAALGVPLGLWLLAQIDATAIRWAVSIVGALTVAALMSGWQWRGRLGLSGLAGVGGAAGFVGGLTALTGPIAILFYLANARNAAAVRANMVLFLGALDVLLAGNIWATGGLSADRVALGLVLCVPYVAGITMGMALFDPSRERLYRAVALIIVIAAMLSGLPIWE